MPSTNSNTPIKRVFTDEEIALLSGIFRLVLKEIASDADKSSIAPGEPAIDYNTGVLYVRNPHTGNLISPNGLERMQMIAEHFDINGILSSDLIGDLAVYTDLSELPEPIPTTNPDTIISHMSHHPSVFVGPIESDAAGWPSKKGYFIVVKYDEETVLVRFFDLISNTAYYGIYNQESHLLNGWTAYYSIGQFTESEDTDKINVELDMNITDLGGFTVRLVNGLEPNSKVIVNGGPERSIVDLNGNPVDYPIAENNSIMLLYDGLNDVWVLNDSGESATMAGVHLLQRRVTSLNQSFIDLDHSTTTRINELATNLSTEIHNVESNLSSRINYIDNRVSGLVDQVSSLAQQLNTALATIQRMSAGPIAVLYTMAANQTSVRFNEIAGFDSTRDKILVNYGQTLLRETLDYALDDTSVRFTGITFSEGDVVQFIIVKR